MIVAHPSALTRRRSLTNNLTHLAYWVFGAMQHSTRLLLCTALAPAGFRSGLLAPILISQRAIAGWPNSFCCVEFFRGRLHPHRDWREKCQLLSGVDVERPFGTRHQTSQLGDSRHSPIPRRHGEDRPQLARKRRIHSSGSPALRRPSSTTGKGFVRATHLTVSLGLRRRASAKAVFASSALPASA
jgi:hypothetical protein